MKAFKSVSTAKCPVCENPCTGAAGGDDDKRPKKGDVSICSKCLEILKFSDDLGNVELPPREVLREIHLTYGASIFSTRVFILTNIKLQ